MFNLKVYCIKCLVHQLDINLWNKFIRADHPKFVVNEGKIMERLLLRQRL